MRSGPRPKLTACLAMFLLTALLSGCKEKQEASKPEPPEVEVTDVTQRDVPVYHEWVAQLNGRTNAQITPRVQGYLLVQNYRNGFFVKKGQLLYEIDPRAFEVAISQAKAQVAVAVANLSNAETNVARDKPLAAQSAIPQKQLDTDLATQAASTAQLDAAKAQLAQAQLNLTWTRVYSPIEGIAGLSTSQIGDLVGTTTVMTTVSQVNPIWAYFNISESDYLSEAQRFYLLISGKKVASPVLEFIQANGDTFPRKGRIVLVNREVASQTGTIQLVAEFPNANAVLRPGGFGRVRFQTGMNDGALLVPQAAVIEVQSMYQVAVVEPGNKAAFRVVKVGDRIGTDWIITEGLKPGDQVIVQGFMKVREGTPVRPKPFVAAAVRN
ncbi:MAG TPA: efflux RND transporter periplasmic adaptor subunit [Acidobacteriaceae bacterium]|nr:efflux RND transporter periplasmic adaptor subunit [Acidobacteriaceae bacterium]